MHIVSLHLEFGGDRNCVNVLEERHGTHWTEIPCMQAQHGENSVFNVEVVGHLPDPSPYEEKQYLMERYPPAIVEKLYPGRSPRFEFDMPGQDAPPSIQAAPEMRKEVKRYLKSREEV